MESGWSVLAELIVKPNQRFSRRLVGYFHPAVAGVVVCCFDSAVSGAIDELD